MKINTRTLCSLLLIAFILITITSLNLYSTDSNMHTYNDNNIYTNNDSNMHRNKHRNKHIKYNNATPIIINIPNMYGVDTNNYNEKKLKNRLVQPGKYYPSSNYDVYNEVIPINIRTRGLPTEYQQLGILTNTINNDDIRPLYGRQTYSGSNHWNYYSSTDSNLSLKIPIYLTNTKCTDERGCTEIREGDEISIGTSNDKYIVTMYSNEDYRYIPYI